MYPSRAAARAWMWPGIWIFRRSNREVHIFSEAAGESPPTSISWNDPNRPSLLREEVTCPGEEPERIIGKCPDLMYGRRIERTAPSGMFCSLHVYWKSSKRKTGEKNYPPR